MPQRAWICAIGGVKLQFGQYPNIYVFFWVGLPIEVWDTETIACTTSLQFWEHSFIRLRFLCRVYIFVWRPAKWWMFYGCPLAPAPLIWQKSKHQLTLSFLSLGLKTKCLRWVPRISGDKTSAHYIYGTSKSNCMQSKSGQKLGERTSWNKCLPKY